MCTSFSQATCSAPGAEPKRVVVKAEVNVTLSCTITTTAMTTTTTMTSITIITTTIIITFTIPKSYLFLSRPRRTSTQTTRCLSFTKSAKPSMGKPTKSKWGGAFKHSFFKLCL